jgi:RimJ/RimL family protein N-acetyltransferase
MTTSITTDPLGVLLFMKRHIPVLGVEVMTALGFKRDDRIVFGVLYQFWTEKSVWCHIAKESGVDNPFTREFLRLGFSYPFEQVGVEQMLGMVDASNTEARRLDEHFGFKPVSTIPCAGTDGGDLIIYSLKREDCRFIRRKERSDVSLAYN